MLWRQQGSIRRSSKLDMDKKERFADFNKSVQTNKALHSAMLTTYFAHET